MNREIKFRTWDKQYKQWTSLCRCAPSNGIPINSFFKNSSLEYVIQQFTGLKDKNGKDIYEGDILFVKEKDRYEPYGFNPEELSIGYTWENTLVYWNVELSRFLFQFNKYRNIENPYGYEYIEIIGNIFETPELLK